MASNEQREGLMGRHGGNGSHDWVSRDYAMEIPCPAHRSGKCGMPSAVKIGADFKCQTGVELTATMAHKIKPNRPLDGD